MAGRHALVVVVARPAVALGATSSPTRRSRRRSPSLIRWQSHWHVVRQSWAFFQNDFAGRISNRVMQTGPAVRQTLVSSVTAVWYVLVYGITALRDDRRRRRSGSTLPILAWFAGYVALLWYFVPRLRDRSKIISEARSALIGTHCRQLHQHPDREAVRAPARRGQLRARRGRAPHRAFPGRAAPADDVRHAPASAQCAADRQRRRDRDAAVAEGASRSAPSPWCCR